MCTDSIFISYKQQDKGFSVLNLDQGLEFYSGELLSDFTDYEEQWSLFWVDCAIGSACQMLILTHL